MSRKKRRYYTLMTVELGGFIILAGSLVFSRLDTRYNLHRGDRIVALVRQNVFLDRTFFPPAKEKFIELTSGDVLEYPHSELLHFLDSNAIITGKLQIFWTMSGSQLYKYRIIKNNEPTSRTFLLRSFGTGTKPTIGELIE